MSKTTENKKECFILKTAKLVTGIVSIVLFVLVMFQSCAAGAANTLSGSGEIGGSAGFILSICLLVGGIVAIATRKSVGKGGSIAAAIFYIIGGLLGFAFAGSYSDLYIWSFLSVACGIMHIVSIVKSGKNTVPSETSEKQ